MKKVFGFAAVVATALVLGLTSCNKDAADPVTLSPARGTLEMNFFLTPIDTTVGNHLAYGQEPSGPVDAVDYNNYWTALTKTITVRVSANNNDLSDYADGGLYTETHTVTAGKLSISLPTRADGAAVPYTVEVLEFQTDIVVRQTDAKGKESDVKTAFRLVGEKTGVDIRKDVTTTPSFATSDFTYVSRVH